MYWKTFLINQRNGCGSEEILADSPEEACEIYRSWLTPEEGDYQMNAILVSETPAEKVFSITESQYANMDENYGGYCTSCGEEAYGLEPDACKCVCESCGQPAVYGVEELLIMGLVDFDAI